MRTLTSELAIQVGRASLAPRVYADANLPAPVVAFMRRTLGWDVFFVIEDDQLRRAPDIRHYHLARDMHRTLVTLDRDYLDDRRFPLRDSGGVIVLSAPDHVRLKALAARIDRHLLRPGHPETLLDPAVASLDLPLAGRKLEAHSDWP
jgi:predicted nuclease of predicted toxin-antitoxin system